MLKRETSYKLSEGKMGIENMRDRGVMREGATDREKEGEKMGRNEERGREAMRQGKGQGEM